MKVKSFFGISLLLVCLALFGWILPANAAANNPLFEENVLDVIRAHPEVVLESVQAYQKQQSGGKQERQANLVKELLANPSDIIGDSPKQGSSEKILLVEFSDFQCPFCAKAHSNVNQFIDKNGDEVTLVYKNLPLTQIHSEAMPAAKAAWAANQQGKFWQYHDQLFDKQKKLGEDLYVSIAKQLNLDLERFNSDRAGEAASNAIQQDINLARKLEISGTPFFFMNEEVFSGAVPLAEIESKLSKIKQAVK